MDKFDPNLLAVIFSGVGLGLIPLIMITTTSFLKIAVVLFIIRNALGVQQTPPSLVLYGLALVLTVYVTTPVVGQIYGKLDDSSIDYHSVAGWQQAATDIRPPLHDYLAKFAKPTERAFLLAATKRVWPDSASSSVTEDDLVILVPAFAVSELTRAFEIGFLLYIPFVVIDIVVSNILMSMGMMMMSPTVVSVPFKLFLFVLIDGWSRLTHGLILSYG
jgi:type III secretion protein R